MAWDSRGSHNSIDRGFFSTIMSLLSDAECCSMRNHSDEVMHGKIHGRPEVQQIRTQFPSPFATMHSYDGTPRRGSTPPTSNELPVDFFERLAELVARDPEIAARMPIESLYMVGKFEARSLRVRFLQMCLRGQHEIAKQIWLRLREFDRLDFEAVYSRGPPSREYFINIMMHDEQASDCGSSDQEVRSECTN